MRFMISAHVSFPWGVNSKFQILGIWKSSWKLLLDLLSVDLFVTNASWLPNSPSAWLFYVTPGAAFFLLLVPFLLYSSGSLTSFVSRLPIYTYRNKNIIYASSANTCVSILSLLNTNKALNIYSPVYIWTVFTIHSLSSFLYHHKLLALL